MKQFFHFFHETKGDGPPWGDKPQLCTNQSYQEAEKIKMMVNSFDRGTERSI